MLWFRPWIRIWSRIFSMLVSPDPDWNPNPIKCGIFSPILGQAASWVRGNVDNFLRVPLSGLCNRENAVQLWYSQKTFYKTSGVEFSAFRWFPAQTRHWQPPSHFSVIVLSAREWMIHESWLLTPKLLGTPFSKMSLKIQGSRVMTPESSIP